MRRWVSFCGRNLHFPPPHDIKLDKHVLGKTSRERAYRAGTGKRWDAFISDASEDTSDFVRPLVKALQDSVLEAWYDETTLKVGDRLRESIDRGLSKSRFGIVVLKVAQSDVADYSPTLAGRFANRSQDGLEKVLRQLREAMGKD
jgi:hypothetical protein